MRFFMSRATALLLAALSFSAFVSNVPVNAETPLLSFIEPNLGQAVSDYTHVVRASNYTALLNAREAVFVMSEKTDNGTDKAPTYKTNKVQMQLLGAQIDATSVASESLAGISNYLRGNDPKGWLKAVPHYRKVSFTNVYPGIDLVYTLQNSSLRYDFVLAPQANAEDIRLAFAGSNEVKLGAEGQLHVRAEGAELVHSAPRLFQELDGEQHDVAGGFAVQEDGTLRFRVAAYDNAKTLVIDPEVTFSTYLGGSGYEGGQAIKVDDSGRIFVTGSTWSVDFPTINPLAANLAGASDIYVARLAADGQSLEYATYIGGSGFENPHQINVDTDGNVLLAGYTTSSDYPTVNAVQSTFFGGGLFDSHGFITKLAATGDSLVFSTYFGGAAPIQPFFGVDFVRGMTVDTSGNVFVTGETSGAGFPETHELDGRGCLDGETGVVNQFIGDAFVAKLNANGAVIFAVCIGGAERDTGRGIALSGDGSIVIAGFTRSADYPVTSGAYQSSLAAPGSVTYDAHVTRLNATGTAILGATYIGGTDTEFVQQIRVAADGSSVVVGTSGSTDFPTTPGVLQPVKAGMEFIGDATVFRLSADASRLLFSTYLGGEGEESGWGLDLDDDGLIYVSGATSSLDFPLVDATQTAIGAVASTGPDVGPPADNTLALAVGSMLLNGQSRTVVVAGNEGVNRMYELDDAGDVVDTVIMSSLSDLTRGVALVDTDLDGLGDAVVAGNEGALSRLYKTNTAGGFQTPIALNGGVQLTKTLIVAQLQDSLHADLVLGNYMEPNLYYRGTSNGFAAADPAFPGSENTATHALAAGDVNGDGIPDVVAGNYMQTNRVYFGTGSGYQAGVAIGSEMDATMAVALADFDGDGDLDLVVGNKGLGAPDRYYRNQGNGVFDATEDLHPDAASTFDFNVRDVGFDGTLDLIAADDSGGRVYLNTHGTGQFTRLPLTSPTAPESAVALAGLEFSNTLFTGKPIGVPIRRLDINLREIFLAVMDLAGRQLLFSTYLGGSGWDNSEWGLDADNAGNVLITGATSATDFPTVAAMAPSRNGASDSFVTKYALNLVAPTPQASYRTTLNLAAPSVDGIDRVVFKWATLSCDNNATGELYDYSMTLYAGNTVIYEDVVMVNGILQSLGDELRAFPYWDFNLDTMLLNQFNTGIDAVVGNTGATGVNFLVTDNLALPTDGIVSIAKYDAGSFVDSDEAVLSSQSTQLLSASCNGYGFYGGHAYARVSDALTWEQARAYAQTRTFMGVAGHLVAITSSPEDAFVKSHFDVAAVPFNGPWIGLFCSTGADCSANSSYEWVTAEAFSYDGFASGEPNGDCAVGIEGACGVEYIDVPGSGWNDTLPELTNDFVIEYPVAIDSGSDVDNDGISDNLDNCTNVPNADQRDTNADGFGNVCDPDLDNDGIVNFGDVSGWISFFNTACGDVDQDFDGNGTCNFGDYTLFPQFFNQPPGPSGLVP